MRLFNLHVYKATQYGTTPTYTAAEFDGPLGTAEKLAVHVRVWRASGTTPKLTLKILHSNDGVVWVAKSTLVNQTSLSTSGETSVLATDDGTTPSGAFVRLSVELANSDNVADIQIIVCGRAEQLVA